MAEQRVPPFTVKAPEVLSPDATRMIVVNEGGQNFLGIETTTPGVRTSLGDLSGIGNEAATRRQQINHYARVYLETEEDLFLLRAEDRWTVTKISYSYTSSDIVPLPGKLETGSPEIIIGITDLEPDTQFTVKTANGNNWSGDIKRIIVIDTAEEINSTESSYPQRDIRDEYYIAQERRALFEHSVTFHQEFHSSIRSEATVRIESYLADLQLILRQPLVVERIINSGEIYTAEHIINDVFQTPVFGIAGEYDRARDEYDKDVVLMKNLIDESWGIYLRVAFEESEPIDTIEEHKRRLQKEYSQSNKNWLTIRTDQFKFGRSEIVISLMKEIEPGDFLQDVVLFERFRASPVIQELRQQGLSYELDKAQKEIRRGSLSEQQIDELAQSIAEKAMDINPSLQSIVIQEITEKQLQLITNIVKILIEEHLAAFLAHQVARPSVQAVQELEQDIQLLAPNDLETQEKLRRSIPMSRYPHRIFKALLALAGAVPGAQIPIAIINAIDELFGPRK